MRHRSRPYGKNGQVPDDLKQEPRVRDSGLLTLLKYQFDCCEVTGISRDLHLHHVLFRSQGGDDLRANIVCLTSDLHTRYHAADAVARLLIAEYLRLHRQDTLDYLARKLGVSARDLWLERHGIAYEDIERG